MRRAAAHPLRAGESLVFLLTAAALLAAVYVGWLQLRELPRHRIHVRWAPETSSLERLALEQQTGLHSGREREPRTWVYLLRDHSRDNIRRLVQSPSVEDTAYIDRQSFHLQLDWAGRPGWLRQLAETERLPFVGLALVALAATGMWRSRYTIAAGARAALWLGQAALRLTLRGLGLVVRWLQQHDRAELTRGEMSAGLGLGLIFLLPLLLYGPYEEEIVQATVFPNQVFYRALFRGEWLLWLNDLGFGTPFPIGDPFMFHPLFAPLAGAGAPLRVILSALWIAHTGIMVVFFLRLCAVSGIHAPLRYVLLACYLGSTTSVTYFYNTDWVQMMITWTLFPVLVFYLRATIRGEAVDRFWLSTVRLALLFGFWVINAHPGYIVPLVLVSTVYALAAARPIGAVYACLVTSAWLCLLVVLSRVYFLLSEMRSFGAQASYARGYESVSSYIGTLGIDVGDRSPFIGWGLVIALAASMLQIRTQRDPHLRACALAVVAAVALSIAPVLPGLSPFLFRDGMVFFGIVAAGHTLQRWLGGGKLWPVAVLLLIAVQGCHQWTAIVQPSLKSFAEGRGRLLFYRYQGKPVGLGKVLVAQAQRHGPRVYLSPDVDRLMRGRLSRDGVHFSSDLVFLGLNPVNGWFKNVSMETLAPAELVMEAYVRGDWSAIQNRALLDVLGIDLVVTSPEEGSPPEGLTIAERFRSLTHGTLLVLANPDAWPLGVLLEANAHSTVLPVQRGCAHRAALCREFETLARMRLPAAVTLTAGNGWYVARVPPADRERLLFLSVYHRPQWEATSPAGRLTVHPVAGAFLGVTVPPGVSEVTLRYVPRTLIALTWVSNLTFVGLLAGCYLLGRRPAAISKGADE